MSTEALLKRLERDLTPLSGAKERIWARIEKRCNTQSVLSKVPALVRPSQAVKQRIWARVVDRIDVSESVALLEKLKELLVPPPELGLHLRRRFALAHAPVAPFQQRAFKWVAAAVVIALLVKAGPQLLIAPRTVAQSAVTLLPTRGEVVISIGDLWQPVTDEIVLEPGALLRTHQGEASILLRDDGVIRLDAGTTIQIHDTSDPADVSGSTETMLTLIAGRIWVQGLIPVTQRGISVRTDNGLVNVNEGSVSIAESDGIDVKVWDRRAQVIQGENEVYLVAGERIRLSEGGSTLIVKKISDDQYEDAWVQQNLKRDAVHRRSIAQLQQERRAARAGILPTSILYPAKRIAEKVDVLLTFGGGAKAQKRLDHASARLDEAAALLADGDMEAVRIPLEAYRDSLLAVATGSGDDLVQNLIQQSLALEAGDSAAVLPGDDAYLIKKAILEASAEVPKGTVTAADVEGVLLVDTIAALLQKLDEEGTYGLEEIWTDLSAHLTVLSDEGSDLRPEVRKEARVLLSEFAFVLLEYGESEGVDSVLLSQVEEYLPPQTESVGVLSDEEVSEIVASIKTRIFIYHMAKSRINQLIAEFKALEGHPDQGRILRQLRFALPDGPEEFPLRVRKEIIRLQWARAVVQ
ncbi:FecR domain-containing protein [Patescibacteria group bacterium]|nr:FecR domain-containing protein [Patescibacteria group bacterium]